MVEYAWWLYQAVAVILSVLVIFAHYGLFLPVIARNAPQRLSINLSWLFILMWYPFFSYVYTPAAGAEQTALEEVGLATYLLYFFGVYLLFNAIIFMVGYLLKTRVITTLEDAQKSYKYKLMLYTFFAAGTPLTLVFILFVLDKMSWFLALPMLLVVISIIVCACIARYGVFLPTVARDVPQRVTLTISWLFVLALFKLLAYILGASKGLDAITIELGPVIKLGGTYVVLSFILCTIGLLLKKHNQK